VIVMNNTAAATVTCPSGIFAAGDTILVLANTANQVTMAGSGFTPTSYGGALKLLGQYTVVTVLYLTSSSANITGALTT
jgi:hypothetical protein